MYQVTLQHAFQGPDAERLRSDVLSGRSRQAAAAVSHSQPRGPWHAEFPSPCQRGVRAARPPAAPGLGTGERSPTHGPIARREPQMDPWQRP